MLVFHFLPHEHGCPLLPDEANKNKTISVIAKRERERESGIPDGFGEVFLKKLEILQRMYRSLTFLPPRHFAVFDG